MMSTGGMPEGKENDGRKSPKMRPCSMRTIMRSMVTAEDWRNGGACGGVSDGSAQDGPHGDLIDGEIAVSRCNSDWRRDFELFLAERIVETCMGRTPSRQWLSFPRGVQ